MHRPRAAHLVIVCAPDVRSDSLIVMEAMKMEHVIRAPRDGVVDKVFFRDGDFVDGERSIPAQPARVGAARWSRDCGARRWQAHGLVPRIIKRVNMSFRVNLVG